MSTELDYSTAPLISPDMAVRSAAIGAFWMDVHRLLNQSRPANDIIDDILKLAGMALGAERSYTFSVTTNRDYSSCTHEWTSKPEYAIRPFLQNIDQRGLKGWLSRFDRDHTIVIEDIDNPPDDLRAPAAKFKRDNIRSIYVFGFFDDGNLIGYLGIDYISRTQTLDIVARNILFQLASTLNLFVLRHETLELWNETARTLPSAMFIKNVDNDLRYSYANPKYLSIFGNDIVGRRDEDIFGAEHGPLFRKQDQECLESGTPFRYDGPQSDYAKDTPGYYSLVKFPVTTQMGRRYIAGFITDISNEHNLRIQTQELLEQSRAAEKAKSLFLASMSHEIRTPLNAIIGLVDELRHTDIPEQTRNEYLISVNSASRALLALINDVLDMSKLEAGQMHMTPVETDLLILLAECESIFAENSKTKGLSYTCEVSPNLPILIIDTTRVRQILFNLISNAVKFTSKGGIYVSGTFTRQTAKTGVLKLEVTDTGCGISPEDQQHVFGMFEQASRMRGTRVANMGTGLGLCLSKRLSECMNGNIELTSEIGKGSTFKVIFSDVPFVERDKASDVIRHRKDQTIRISSMELERRVLIVDDVPMNLKILGIILKRMNVDFVPAGSAKEALEILKRDSKFTHILTDIWMPDMNGEALARTIRQNPAWSKLRIAAQTADVEASGTFDVSVFNTVLSKPLTPEKLMAFLRR